MRQPTQMPDWMEKQFENAEKTIQTWSEGKREAAGIPSGDSNRVAGYRDERIREMEAHYKPEPESNEAKGDE